MDARARSKARWLSWKSARLTRKSVELLHLEAESRDVPGVDVVNQQLWLAVPRNVQKGAPRRFQVRVASEKSAEGWVRAAEVIHKPAIGRHSCQFVADPPGSP